MAKNPNGSLKTAQNVSVTSAPLTLKDSIGNGSKFDFYRFSLASRSSFNLKLFGLNTKVSTALLNSQAKVLSQVRQPKKGKETIGAVLDAGTYYIRLTGSSGSSTRYRLTLAATETVPTLTVNSGLSVAKGKTATITGNQLTSTGIQQPATGLIYTLTSLPENGTLKLNGSPLGVGSRFTQADINSGSLSYTSFGKAAQLSNSSTNATANAIDGSNIVWTTTDASGNKQLFLYRGATGTATPISGNSPNTFFAGLSGSNVVWITGSTNPTAYQSFFYNGTTGKTTTLSGDSSKTPLAKLDTVAGVSGSKAVFSGLNGASYQVFLYDNATGKTVQLTNNPGLTTLYFPIGISGSNVVWNTVDTKGQLTGMFFYNGTTGTAAQIGSGTKGQVVGVSGNYAVWGSLDSNNQTVGVFLYNNNTNSSIQVASNAKGILGAAVDGLNVVWNSSDGTNTEVFLYNGATGQTKQLTSNTTSSLAKSIVGENVVYNSLVNGKSAVFFYNVTTGTTTQVTDGSVNSVAASISGSNVIWSSSVDGKTASVFLGNLATSDRFNFTVTDGSTQVVNSSFNLILS